MVSQGDIIKINFTPRVGHEQAGFRPAVVISNDIYNLKTKLAIVCPITNTNNTFPLHIPLDQRTVTTGFVLCEHVRTLDLNARNFYVVEKMPEDILEHVIDVVYSEVEFIKS